MNIIADASSKKSIYALVKSGATSLIMSLVTDHVPAAVMDTSAFDVHDAKASRKIESMVSLSRGV